MTAPKTLLQMAGAPAHPAPLDAAALVIIDAQGEYRDGRLPLEGIDPALDRLAALLAAARAAGTPVIHIAHKGRAGSLFDREGPGGAILPQVAPRDGEAVVEKGLPNAFAGTDLQERLKATGRGEVLLAGFQTHMCISATARAALDLGWRVTVAGDACATRALPDPMGGASIGGAEIHRIALAELADRFAIVAPVATIIG
ncbi:cysteine hydrolase family protein [Paracraurococcus ruber]|uniref:Cysteine hydrolase n=1 Tax=Paracraurococcus ruber TaxID=77675 RepID=A0ABS1D3J7_9PROT|nr:cysteine hydrolase family protein [Paracraurococcus ruber]MBK1661126.1 cysteine hydrolase [Paracraurococcus ruber]TDG22545.1 cysteine hydrolase [Paracraurococcus ruber]